MQKRPQPLAIEALEPRVLLSAELLGGASLSDGLATSGEGEGEGRASAETADVVLATVADTQSIGRQSTAAQLDYDPRRQMDDLFGGEELLAQESVPDSTPAASTSDSSKPESTLVDASQAPSIEHPGGLLGLAADPSVASDEPALSVAPVTDPENPRTDAAGVGMEAVAERSGAAEWTRNTTPVGVTLVPTTHETRDGRNETLSAVDRSVQTLRAANAPPAEGSSGQDVHSLVPTSGENGSLAEGISSQDPVTNHSPASEPDQGTASPSATPGVVLETAGSATTVVVADGRGNSTGAEVVLEVGTGSILHGAGNIPASILNRGLLSPGNSPGIWDVAGNLTLDRAGSLLLELGGTSPGPGVASGLDLEPAVGSPLDGYDQINVAGKVTFGGKLDLDLIDGFIPTVGDGFDVITFTDGYFGAFDDYRDLVIPGVGFLKPVYSPTKLRLEMVAGSATMSAPILFIPGFAGTQSADSTPAGVEYWLTHRGLSPDLLVLEPLANSYSDIVQSLVNSGYTNGVDLFVVNWDWRTPVALQDGTPDGVLAHSTLPGYSLSDGQFESGLDYLGAALARAASTWSDLKGSAPALADILTHSTGGLVSRSYLQSDLYATGGLPGVRTLIQSGVPNQGTGSTLNFLLNSFGLKSTTRLLGRVLD
ncbi:MAG: LEPR-XLL domain-containing protein, partial [Verrucomicrobiales bacterium]|nr:LEPR-XLL domain-containing protein [Verrucomicrobiales bacterium]